MLDLGRFCAWVTIGTIEAPEYGVEVSEDGSSVNCWIASEVGKNFAVHWTDKTAQDDTNGTVRVDGAWVRNQVSRRGEGLPKEVSAARISRTKLRDLIFSPTMYTDDDAYLDQVSPQLGTIILKIDQVHLAMKAEASPSTRFAPSQPTKVHERAKKLSMHSVQYGAERSGRRSGPRTTTRTVRSAIMTFTFKYRPLEFLQAQGIAPRLEPPNVDVEGAQGMLDDGLKPETVDEAEIDAEIQELQAKLDAALKKKNIKRAKREHVPACLPGEVIDLT